MESIQQTEAIIAILLELRMEDRASPCVEPAHILTIIVPGAKAREGLLGTRYVTDIISNPQRHPQTEHYFLHVK